MVFYCSKTRSSKVGYNHPNDYKYPCMTLTGVFGGTFDPVHFGHLRALTRINNKLQFDSIHFIPAFIPPHRASPHASARHRLQMVRLALADYPQFILDQRELQRSSPSWTIDTLKSLYDEDSTRHLCLIMGIDALLGLPDWHRWQEILQQAHIVAMRRPGYQRPDPLPDWWQQAATDNIERLQQKQAGTIIEIDIEPIAISATDIRAARRNGDDFQQYLPDAVYQYILEHDLYSEDPA